MQIIYNNHGIERDFGCRAMKQTKFGCLLEHGEPMCSSFASNLGIPSGSYGDCKESCTKEANYSCKYNPIFHAGFCQLDSEGGMDAKSCSEEATNHCKAYENP